MKKSFFIGGLIVSLFIGLMAYGAFSQATDVAAMSDSPEYVIKTETFAANNFQVIFTGFPPTIPHPLTNRGGSCKLCHDVEKTTSVPQTPHPERDNCVQCHVNQ